MQGVYWLYSNRVRPLPPHIALTKQIFFHLSTAAIVPIRQRITDTLRIRNLVIMQFPAVNWHEGLFLQPHHFQAWDRHWSERVTAGEQWQNPYFYGITEIAINSAALAAGHFQLDALKARTPAGGAIAIDGWTTVGPLRLARCTGTYAGSRSQRVI